MNANSAQSASSPVQGAVALVTGANRGFGRLFARELLARGAAKVYAAARDPRTVTDPGVVPVRLDITDPEQVRAAAVACDDVTLLVNNAGVFRQSPLIGADSTADAHAEMDTNYFGTLAMTRAFAPVLGRNGGGVLINTLSVLSFVNYAPWGSYGASKAALWSLTNATRDELRAQGTLVVAVHSGLADTDMTAGVEGPDKIDAKLYVHAALDAAEQGEIEALVDGPTRAYKAALAGYPVNAERAG
ncbi:SDR family oxidoreductase [Streptomyces liangshanensis]|uniref:SDR family oxidoreductase n=1 Tax=Streptomyces liangshanensis TaxID=2717324 RepID=UPI0036DD3521